VRGLGLPPVDHELGGVSSGPMLKPVFIDGAWSWRLVGVISEAISVRSSTWCVHADGRRNKNLREPVRALSGSRC
jgi:hypothetical protein